MNDMRKLMESVAPLFENKKEIIYNKIVDELIKNADEVAYGHISDQTLKLAHSYFRKDGDYEAAFAEILSHYSDQDGGEVHDLQGVYDDAVSDMEYLLSQDGISAEPVAEPVTEELSQDQLIEYIEELKEIMYKLQELGDHATSIVSEIDPNEAHRLESYGAFDFGSSSNKYDTTLAAFIEDLESGQYDRMEESKEEACPNCGKRKHILKACGSCGCS